MGKILKRHYRRRFTRSNSTSHSPDKPEDDAKHEQDGHGSDEQQQDEVYSLQRGLQLLTHQGPFNLYPQVIHVERFDNIITGSVLYGFYSDFNGWLACYEKKGNLFVLGYEVA